MEREFKPEESHSKNWMTSVDMSKWHWLVLVGTVLGTILEGLIPHSFGTFIANFKSINNTSKTDVSFSKASQFELNWLPALSSALPSILLPLFSIVIKRFRKFYQVVSVAAFLLVGLSCALSSVVQQWTMLFLTYSFLYSIGTSLFLAIVVAIVADYFPHQHRFHVLATSLYQIGYPAAALIGNPLSANLIVQNGWRNTFRLMFLIQILFGIVVAFFMKPHHQGCCFQQELSEETPVYLDGDQIVEPVITGTYAERIKRNYQLYPWLIGKYINYLCWYGLRTNIVTFLVNSTAFGLEWSARLMSVYAAAEILVAVLASVIGDKLRGCLIHVHVIAACSMAILTGIYAVSLTSYLSAIILMMCIGTSVQFSLSFGYPASVELLNSEFDMKTGWIITNVAAGLGILTSPVLSGLLMDKCGPVSLFYAQCVGWALQGIFYGVTLWIVRGKKKNQYDELENGR